ncbi:RELT-like protein 2 [Centropristis striata]|uniref:RELT-like protein 2 n=1 Tax=Centropristis striata TaxID=184440 RepID=UPI0027E0A8EF|nr:RELT-like protein 2 [Centropristis striata]
MSELEASGRPEQTPPYMIFVVVFLFFLTGLFGFLICHLLKKKGYRCRTADMDDEEEEEKLGGNADDDDEENQDTVEQILKCIIENEANMEAFNEMFGNQNVCVRHDPRLRKESIGGVPPHHHTVHSGSDHNSCHLCAKVRSKKGRRQSRTPRSKQRPGEQTVLSVGRFRVTHTDKKLPGSPNPMVSSDQLDQSQDSDDRKDGGYNLRSMFKDVRQPSEGSNGIVPNVGKRRKSLTFFGLRRGSDPVGIRGGEGTFRETGGVRFAIQQQPIVLEEQLQTENSEVTPDRGTEPGVKPKTEPPMSQTPERKAKTLANFPSPQSKDQAQGSKSAPEEGSKLEPSPEPHRNHTIKPSAGSAAASVPSSLPIPSPASPGQTFKTTEKLVDVGGKVLKNEGAFDPGPLQTSTPIAPMPGLIPGFTSAIPADQPEPSSSTGFPITQTPPDQSSSPDPESGFGASLALISLGSSPPSSCPNKTLSSASSLKTPISPMAGTPSPQLSSRNTPSEAAGTLTPSPKLPSSQSPIPSSSVGRSAGPLQAQTPAPSLTSSPKLDTMLGSPKPPSSSSSSSPADQNPSLGSSPHLLSLKEQDLQGARIPKTEERTEKKRVGILKTAKLSPVEGDSGGSALYSPIDQLSKDRLSSLHLSPTSPLSPSSPTGSRISSVAIVKVSPGSKREFSVVTMVDENQSSTSTEDQKGATSELRVEPGKAGTNPEVDQGEEVYVSGVERPERQSRETPDAKVPPRLGQEKDDMMQMEDIRDCKVTQVEEAESVKGEFEKTVNI